MKIGPFFQASKHISVAKCTLLTRKFVVFLLVFGLLGGVDVGGGDSVFALTPKEEKGVKVLKAPSLEYLSPDWLRPVTLLDASNDIADWVSILPYAGDRAADMYLVIPTLGIVTPIIGIPVDSADYSAMANGKEIDINSYLVNGVIHYAQTAHPGEEGNMVVFGHSNFYKNKPGKYKTIFADLAAVDVSAHDEMWVYEKESPGVYRLLKYAIRYSYETTPDDVNILLPSEGKELTVFGCTNGLEGRWVVHGMLLEDDALMVGPEMRIRTWDAQQRFFQLASERQQVVRDEVMALIREKQSMSLDGYTEEEKALRNAGLSYIQQSLDTPTEVE